MLQLSRVLVGQPAKPALSEVEEMPALLFLLR